MKRFPATLEPNLRILFIRLRNIGDVLLMVPTIRAFRDAFPRAQMTALVNAGTECLQPPRITGFWHPPE